MKKVVILYHADCPDGFGAAWAAWKKFGSKAEYIAIPPHELPEKKLAGKEICVLDNGFSAAVQKQLRSHNKKVVVIDHHAGAKDDTSGFPQNIFNNNHSGAVLAWKYFHPHEKLPRLLAYIEDGDLWRFKLPQAHAMLSYIYSRPFDFKEYNTLAKKMESARERKQIFVLGRGIEDYNRVLVDEVVRRAELVRFKGYKILVTNSSSKRFHSEVAHELLKLRSPISIVWRVQRGIIHFSLRSVGSTDVSKIARQFSHGGGHKHAAGFSLPISKGFPWKVIK